MSKGGDKKEVTLESLIQEVREARKKLKKIKKIVSDITVCF